MRVHNYSVYLNSTGYTYLVRKGFLSPYYKWCVKAKNSSFDINCIKYFLSGEGNYMSEHELSKLKLICHVKSKE